MFLRYFSHCEAMNVATLTHTGKQQQLLEKNFRESFMLWLSNNSERLAASSVSIADKWTRGMRFSRHGKNLGIILQFKPPQSSHKPFQYNQDLIMQPKLLVKKLSELATVPTKGSQLAAGYDLYSAYDYLIKAHGKEMVKTDISIALPSGCYGRVAPRSGLAWKHSIDVGAGVIDEDYRGPVNVILFNHGESNFEIKKGDRIAQLICEKIAHTDIVETDNLDETGRGANGFGSTGV